MPTLHIGDLTDTRLDAFARLTDHQLRASREAERGLMVVESPFALGVALRQGLEPVAFLIEERHEARLGELLPGVPDEVPVFVAPRALMSELVGFKVTRGVMGAFRRPRELSLGEALEGARRVAVLEGLVDATNVGAIIRSAAALGVDAVLLDPTCADPLARRAVRVSMGTVLQVRWARVPADGPGAWPEGALGLLHDEGFHVAALALAEGATPLGDPALAAHERLALVLGCEGWGISAATLAACDEAVVIPMAGGVDSLNVGAAAAVAFWELRARS